MKRGYSEIENQSSLCNSQKRICNNPPLQQQFCCPLVFPSRPDKRDSRHLVPEECKRSHIASPGEHYSMRLPTDVVRKLAFCPQSLSPSTHLPPSAILDIEKEALKQFDYCQHSLVLYNDVSENKNQTKTAENDHNTPLLYSSPQLHQDFFMEVLSPVSNEAEEGEVNLHDQMRETGMRGMPLPENCF